MELRQHLSVLRNRLWLLLLATVLAAAVGFTTSSTTSTYLARSTLYVGSRTLQPVNGDLSNDRLAALERFILTYSKMIDSEPIARQAVDAVKVDRTAAEVVDETRADPEPSTQLLYIEVRDRDPEVAQTLSNALATTFVKAVQEFEPTGGVGEVPQLPAYVFERAGRPDQPEADDQVRTTLLAALFGLLAGAALVFLLDYLDVSLRGAADVERRLELPVLGVLPTLAGDAPFADLTATPVTAPAPRAPRARRTAKATKKATKKAAR